MFEWYIYILMIALLIAGIILVGILINKAQSKKIKNAILAKLSKKGSVYLKNKQHFLKIKNEEYEIIFYYLNNKTELSVNSPRIWEEKSSVSNLVDQSKLTKSPGIKIIIVYPSTNRILRYINENEVEFIETKLTYNFYLITYNKIDELLNKL